MSVKTTYVSAACNYVPGAADWGNNNLICYGSCNSVLIYDPHQGGGRITCTLNKHTNRVNAVRWIAGSAYEHEIVSVGCDKLVIVWSLNKEKYSSCLLKGHEDVVTVVDALYKDLNTKHAIIVTGSSDSKIKIWERFNAIGEILIKQTLDMGYNIAVSLRICVMPKSSDVLIACGTNQSKIQLFVEHDNDFQSGPTLSGHEDWVSGLDFTVKDDNILLASASQDHYIRVWKFININDESFISQQVLQTNDNKLNIIIDSVLAGHDGWVYSVNWCDNKLLSASLDKSMIVWEFNEDESMWLESDRVGEIGGNTLGFYGGLFSKDAQYMLAHGYHGAFHIWKFDEKLFMWIPQVTVGGHFKEVTDICWDPLGHYLMSVSADQTTRIHARWKKNADESTTWHEVARPQVHGFDIACLAIIDHYRFVSGAEEKIIRSFQAPQTFVDNFQRICNIDNGNVNYDAPKGASVPSLGLSNKAIYKNDNDEQARVKSKKDMYPEESHFTAVTLTEPPTEDLMQNTLWPEIQKLYGHGYELYALAASPCGKYIVSSCKATTPEHAAVIVWETTSWQIVQKLVSHTLTIVQLAFSPDSQHILSVSRDRRWSLFGMDKATGLFALAATTVNDKKNTVHSRIIWCCAWTHDSTYFATGSRDGKVAVWTKGVDAIAPCQDNPLGSCKLASCILQLNKESITALAFTHELINDNYLLAVGLETGFISLYKWNTDGFVNVITMDQSVAHHLTVKRLSFRPPTQFDDGNSLQLASCSADFSVRIYDINKNF